MGGPSWLSPNLTLPSPRGRKGSLQQFPLHSTLPSSSKMLNSDLSSSYPLCNTSDNSSPVPNQASSSTASADRHSKVPQYFSQMSLPERMSDSSNFQRAAAAGHQHQRLSRNSAPIGLYSTDLITPEKCKNPGDVYVANTIQISTAKDYPPSKIHALHQGGRNTRSFSTPVDIKRNSALLNMSGVDVEERRGEGSREEEENFRARSRNHVNPREKWCDKKKRSLSCPVSNFVFVDKYDTFNI